MFLRNRFYLAIGVSAFVTGLGYIFPVLFGVGRVMLLLLAILTAADFLMLYYKKGIRARRECASRFSNGDDNEVRIHIENTYPFHVWLDVVDEIPFIFQRRDVCSQLSLSPDGAPVCMSYYLRPTRRGVYGFGHIRLFVRTAIGLLERRYTQGEPVDVAVYPSYLMLNRYELLAMSNRLTELGIKKIRRVGNNTEFEQIKEYVKGDEYRTINWKASARRHQLMVNVYQDERSQQVFSCIDKGRVMQQAFEGMTLLDYAINATLVLSHIVIRKEDKAGVVTFADRFDSFVPAMRKPGHIQTIMESLYAQQTSFGETDFSHLYVNLNKHVSKRSLFILYTNFSGVTEMERQLPFLKHLNSRHRLLVVFFEDVELLSYIQSQAHGTEEYYQHVIAEKFAFEKRLIVSKLKQHGILSLLTVPERLSVDVINKYLELKTRQMLT